MLYLSSSQLASRQYVAVAVHGAAVLVPLSARTCSNASRHRALPKHGSGPHAGKHMTPAEAWGQMLVPEDQHIPDATTLAHLFRPAVLRVEVEENVGQSATCELRPS